MKKIFKSQALACALAFVCVFAACKPTNGPGNYEEGTIVTFNYNDQSSRPLKVEVDAEGKVKEPSVPKRTGYDFSHWSTAAQNGEKVTFPYAATAATELFAVWTAQILDVTFDLNYENSEPIVKQVEYSKSVDAPTELPTRDGYDFRYWTKEVDGPQVSFPYENVKSDLTFYAAWLDAGTQTFDVSFDLNYEGAPAEQVPPAKEGMVEGEELTVFDMPADPVRAGYKFLGWSETQDGAAIELPYAPTGATTLYATWEQQQYIVNFRYNYPQSPSLNYQSQTIMGAEFVEIPENPTRPGHTFAGWYNTAVGGSEVDLTKPIVANANYYAHWQSEAVVTDTFQAEFTFIDSQEKFPGYSGEAYGAAIALCDDFDNGAGNLIHTNNDYPTNSYHVENHGHYVSYLYKENATLTFEIYSDRAVSNATLQANLAAEVWDQMTITSADGPVSYKFFVNDQAVDYGSISFAGKPNLSGGQYKCGFELYTIGNISLKEGKNVIKLVTKNSSGGFMGGTMGAVAPLVDCIKITNAGSAQLSYYPIYDNLWQSKL